MPTVRQDQAHFALNGVAASRLRPVNRATGEGALIAEFRKTGIANVARK